ncbi:MAG: tetratricopeptide repeat protein [Alistipes sp.]
MRKSFILILLCLLLCGFSPARHTASHRAASVHKAPREGLLRQDTTCALWHYTEAVKQSAIHGDSAKALVAARRALAVDSLYAPAAYVASRMSGSDRNEALRLARKAYEADTTNISYLELLADAAVHARRYDEAVDYYSLLVQRGREPEWFRILALLYQSNDKPFSAIATLDSAEVRIGRNPYLARMRQQLLLSTRQFDRAEREARQTIDAMPYLPDGYIDLANTYAAMGDDSLAMRSYYKAVEAAPDRIDVWMDMGEYAYNRRRYDLYLQILGRVFDSPAVSVDMKIAQFRNLTSSRAFYRNYYPQLNALAGKLMIRHSDDSRVVDLYAEHLIASGEVEQALALYKQNLNEQSAAIDEYLRIIEMEHYLKHADSVEHYLARALYRFPRNADLHTTRGHLHLVAERYNEAVAAYNEALKYAPTDSLRGALWGHIGDAEHLRGDMRRCYAAFEKSLACYADNASTLNNYAYFLSLEGRDLERALAFATRATSLSQNNPTFLDTQAWVLYHMGRYDEAKKIQQQAMSLDRSSSADMALHYGDILDALGEKFMAQTYWRKALERGADAEAIESRLNGTYRTESSTGKKSKKR